MLPPELTDIIIALLRQEDHVFLGWEYGIPAESVSGYIAGQLFRVKDYDELNHVLYLKPEGNAPGNAYHDTFNRYGKMFASMEVKRIVISNPRMLVLKQTAPAYFPPPVPQYHFEPQPQAPPRSTRFTDILTFDIRDAVFDDGIIKFQVKVKSVGQNVDVAINNHAVKKYFDSVKNYIWKLFGSKKTSCTITFDMQFSKCVPVSVDSCDLLHLDETILHNIQESWVDQYILSGDREDIMALDDLIEPLKDGSLNGESLFNHLVQETKTKHHHHLRYLSARQAIDLQKLSITGKPISFAFVIREKENIFLVWETYLTQEATYIWKLTAAADIKKTYGLILEMRKGKRMMYRKKKEDGFYFIEHDYQEQKMNGFLKWKEELEKIIGNE
ncbi:MAG: hypothetical protein V4557_12595 [Bacteroidota bacterium]